MLWEACPMQRPESLLLSAVLHASTDVWMLVEQASERTRTAEEVEAEQQLREDRAKKAQARRMSADALGDEEDLADDVLGADGLRLGGFAGRRERQKRAGKAAATAEPSGTCLAA